MVGEKPFGTLTAGDAVRPTTLTDRYQRHLNYLRISVTDRCNLQCRYCVPRERIPRLGHADILRYEEILRIVRVGVSLGITKLRITGGEPLMRRGLLDFVRALKALPGLADVSLTSNGVLLGPYLEPLYQAGIRRLNISLDTLQRARFAQLTGADRFDHVWQAIQRARVLGFHPIKLNVVGLRGVNDDEFETLAALTREHPYHVRFIEYMPMGNPDLPRDPFVDNDTIRRRLERMGPLEPITRSDQDGPAARFRWPGAPGEVGFISPRSHHFCRTCNRLRLTASGKLRPCLLADRDVDFKAALRAGVDDESLAKLFVAVAHAKPQAHHLADAQPQGAKDQMQSIGG